MRLVLALFMVANLAHLVMLWRYFAFPIPMVFDGVIAAGLCGALMLAGPDGSRSSVIERILRQFIRRRQRAAADARDLAILNRHSKKLNAEAEDVLRFQTWPEE